MVEEVEDYAIFLLDVNGIIQNWNKGAERIKGYKSDEIIGQHFRIFYSEKDRVRGIPEKLLHEAIAHGKARTEGWRIRKDGSALWANVVITALHDEDHNLLGFTKITHDLTRQRQAKSRLKQYALKLQQKNEEIRRSKEQYYKMVDEIEDYAIFMIDPHGFVKSWNRGAERIKGYTKEEIAGEHFSIFYTGEDRAKQIPQNNLAEAARNGKLSTEGWRIRKDGGAFWASVVITALHDDAGNIIGYSKITKDLTDKKLVEDVRQLAQKNKELEQLVYTISHDLQEPLSSITGFARMLEKHYRGQLDENADKYLHYITESCSRMSELIKALLNYSLIGRKRKLEKVNCNKLVRDVIKDLYSSISKSNANITIGYLPVLDANSVELKLLFQNLIANAIKFRREGIDPRIHVDACKIKNGWEFTISDNGVGIDSKFSEKIFDIFQRLHSKNEFEGTGIGLSHCKKIVGLYGGDIWVESQVDKGSTFHFTIPQ